MKAIVVREAGDADGLMMSEVEEPTLAAGEVLIRTQASGLNGADLLQRRGLYPPPKGSSPLIGLEVSGTIEKMHLGAEKLGFHIGDPVMALLSGGGYAEKVAIRHDQIMRVPRNISLVDAGGITEVFVTAYLELVILGHLQKGERLLIHAGASGVGTAAIQIARSIGAEIWVTAGSDEKLGFCKELGAHHLINYKTESFAERILADTGKQGVNCILDLVGASHFSANLEALSLDGRIFHVGLSGGTKTELDLRLLLGKRASLIGSTLRSRTYEEKADIIKKFWAYAEQKFSSGEFHPVIDTVFAADDVKEAHLYMESQKNRGKILLKWS
ncbi:MAG: NAD(P)H-quinone oxidoreductase [Proteobacteria bacterium]|nr:MAG: NAD(P)H-quinone oxidoreductase [Pseudomonadota bacterium]